MLYQSLSGQTILCQGVKVTGSSIHSGVTLCRELQPQTKKTQLCFYENSPGAVVSNVTLFRPVIMSTYVMVGVTLNVWVAINAPIYFVNGYALWIVVIAVPEYL